MLLSLLLAWVITCGAPPEPAEKTTEMLAFVAAQQLNTSAIYDTLSYSAVFKSATLETFSPELFRQTVVYRYSRRGTSLLLTREASDIIEEQEQRVNGKLADPIFKVRKQFTVKRLLVTDEFVLFWPDAATPRLDLYNAADWKGSERGYKQNLLVYTKAADLKSLCFGQANPFHELLPLSPEFTSWELAARDYEELEIRRTLAVSQERKIQDLTLVISERSGLLRKGIFKPGSGSESNCEVTYTEFSHKSGALEVPKSYVSKSTNDAGTVIEETEINFSDFRDEAEQPSYTLSDMGLPEGAEVRRGKYPTGVEYLQWKGGALEEIPSSNSSLGKRK